MKLLCTVCWRKILISFVHISVKQSHNVSFEMHIKCLFCNFVLVWQCIKMRPIFLITNKFLFSNVLQNVKNHFRLNTCNRMIISCLETSRKSAIARKVLEASKNIRERSPVFQRRRLSKTKTRTNLLVKLFVALRNIAELNFCKVVMPHSAPKSCREGSSKLWEANTTVIYISTSHGWQYHLKRVKILLPQFWR